HAPVRAARRGGGGLLAVPPARRAAPPGARGARPQPGVVAVVERALGARVVRERLPPAVAAQHRGDAVEQQLLPLRGQRRRLRQPLQHLLGLGVLVGLRQQPDQLVERAQVGVAEVDRLAVVLGGLLRVLLLLAELAEALVDRRPVGALRGQPLQDLAGLGERLRLAARRRRQEPPRLQDRPQRAVGRLQLRDLLQQLLHLRLVV